MSGTVVRYPAESWHRAPDHPRLNWRSGLRKMQAAGWLPPMAFVLADAIAEHDGRGGAYPSLRTLAAETAIPLATIEEVLLPTLARLGLVYGESRRAQRKPTIWRCSWPVRPVPVGPAPSRQYSRGGRTAWRNGNRPDVFLAESLPVGFADDVTLPPGPFLPEVPNPRRDAEPTSDKEEHRGSLDPDYPSPRRVGLPVPKTGRDGLGADPTTRLADTRTTRLATRHYPSTRREEPVEPEEQTRWGPPVPASDEPPQDDQANVTAGNNTREQDEPGQQTPPADLDADHLHDERRDDDGMAEPEETLAADREPLDPRQRARLAVRYGVDGFVIDMLAEHLAGAGLGAADVLPSLLRCIDCKTAAARENHITGQVLDVIKREGRTHG